VSPDDDPPLDDALAAAKPAEAPGLLLAQARIAGALFGEVAPGFGRFRVLERLGGGGMGVVYAAYDPQLDRGVALKTVHVPSGSRELALREAKALAKLSHPNIVPVFDVGLEQDQVYIVMELVRGQTLRAWAKDRTALAIVDAYRQAAHALAAAHDAGLVHRDFKPDNALVGTDGRVRVVDFGLALEAQAASAGAGTPAYMAPEQAAGGAVTPAADQYSLCASLREAIAEPRPAWIESIVARGTAAEPSARFASMHELARALGRDPARVRRWRLIATAIAVVLLGATAGAFAIGRSASALEACGGGPEQLARAWAPAAQRAELARIAGLSSYGRDVAARLDQQLATHRTRWIANARDACLAHRRGEQSDALLDRRMACLGRGRAALSAMAELTTSATAATLPDLAQAASALPVPDACADVAALVADVEPPAPAIAPRVAAIRADLERARIEIAAGHFADARTRADASIAAARTVGYPPVLAEATLVAGRAAMELGDHDASARLGEAATLGVSTGQDAIGIEAWARRAYVRATTDEAGDPLAGSEIVQAIASRTRSAFARALLANNIGSVELGENRRADARVSFEQALAAARDVEGPGAVELVNVRINLAIVTDDPTARDRLLVDAHDQLARLLGPDHPATLFATWNRVMRTLSAPREAAAALEQLCARDELHPTLAARTALCWVELADVRDMLGDRRGAVTAIDRGLSLGAATSDEVPEAAGYALLWHGDAAGAVRSFESALAAVPVAPGEPWFRTFTRAKLQLGLARAHRDPAALGEALDVLTVLARDQQAAAIERRLAVARQLRAQAGEAGRPTSRTRSSATP
jgi:predicted Ser/Thr protein kinase